MNNLANTASVFVIAGYLGMVVYRGNMGALLSELPKDAGYIEFLVAGAVLKVIVDNPNTHSVALGLVAVSIVAVLLKAASGSGNLSALSEFGAGRAGIFQTVTKLFGA